MGGGTDSSKGGLLSFVAVMSSLISLIVSFLNAAFYFADRESKARQELFNNQIGVAKIYFEKLATNFCGSRQEALLLVNITDFMAKPPASKVRVPFLDGSSDADQAAIGGLAQLMKAEFEKRSCGSEARVGENKPNDASGVVSADRQPNTTYALKEQITATPQMARPTGSQPSYTVYIQYKGNEERARQLRAAIDADPNLKAPAIEHVADVPSRNEIRIYKDSEADRSVARDLQARFGLNDARVVSLAKAYPGLTANTLEIWLKD
jgi:hypothetical protein